MVAVGKLPVIISAVTIPVNAPDVRVFDVVLFVIGEMRAVDHDYSQIRAGICHRFRGQLVVLVVDLIPLVAVDHSGRISGIRNEVLQNVGVAQCRAVSLHPVDPHIAVI